MLTIQLLLFQLLAFTYLIPAFSWDMSTQLRPWTSNINNVTKTSLPTFGATQPSSDRCVR